jgi:hypothetical protein
MFVFHFVLDFFGADKWNGKGLLKERELTDVKGNCMAPVQKFATDANVILIIKINSV